MALPDWRVARLDENGQCIPSPQGMQFNVSSPISIDPALQKQSDKDSDPNKGVLAPAGHIALRAPLFILVVTKWATGARWARSLILVGATRTRVTSNWSSRCLKGAPGTFFANKSGACDAHENHSWMIHDDPMRNRSRFSRFKPSVNRRFRAHPGLHRWAVRRNILEVASDSQAWEY